MEFTINDPQEMAKVVEHILRHESQKRIFFLEGNLGAGKTQLVSCFASKMGFQGQVNSPTFSLINEYQTPNTILYHMDLYRIEKPEDLLEIGIEDYLRSGHYCLIEWPQLLDDLFDLDALRIKIEIISFSERKVLI